MTENVIIDCDNTMGIPGKEIDDGLAILLMAANEKIKIRGITGVFGNGDINEVIKSTKKLLYESGLGHLSIYPGAEIEGDHYTEASKFLVKEVNKNPGKINILAIGPLTNLAGAKKIDNDFFKKTKRVVIMGGITEPLIFNNKVMDELNFSSDPKSAYTVLNSKSSLVLADSNLCLQAFFGDNEIKYINQNIKWISKFINPWYKKGKELIDKEGFYMWDLVAALYLIRPKIFEEKYYLLNSSVEDLSSGRLIIEHKENPNVKEKGIINIPTKIKNINLFKQEVFSSWGKYK